MGVGRILGRVLSAWRMLSEGREVEELEYGLVEGWMVVLWYRDLRRL